MRARRIRCTQRAGPGAAPRVDDFLVPGGRYPYFLAAQEREAGRVRVDGRWLSDFATNDYLGLGRDARVLDASAEALRRHGAGAGSAAVLGGMCSLHVELQTELADWLGQEDTLLFPSGFQACEGVVLTLGETRGVALERGAHASLVQGAQGCGQGFRRFDAERPGSLARALELLRPRSISEAMLVVVDAVQSMTGRVCPLEEVHAVAQRQGALLLVDEAHSLGVLGAGRGAIHGANLVGRQVIQVGTFSKSLGSCGGFAAGGSGAIAELRSRSSSALFTAALAPALVAAALESLRILRREPERIRHQKDLSSRLHQGVGTLGRNSPERSRSDWLPIPIVPLAFDSPQALFRAWQGLFERGFFTSPILPPACPPGWSQLRLSCNWGHSAADIDRLVEALGECA